MINVEWTVVGVIVVMVGLVISLIKPIVSLTGSITKLTMAVDRIDEKFVDMQERNHKAHDRLFETQRDHDIRLNDHEKRIDKIENK